MMYRDLDLECQNMIDKRAPLIVKLLEDQLDDN
jgi:hypothetical protein